jgi:hypothetical protein
VKTREIVRQVNELLDVEHDPIGVGAWWVLPNGRLPGGARPIELLGTDDKYSVLRAAHAVIEPIG